MSMPRRWVAAVVCLAAVAGCAGGGESGDIESGEGAETPEAAVEELFILLADGDFAEAASLAVPGQAALASLAEGAPLDEVAAAFSGGDVVVAANFWSGFAQSVDTALGSEVEAIASTAVTRDDTEFHIVEVAMPGGEIRRITTRDVDGYRIDLFATFGPSLAGRLYPQTELLLEEGSSDAASILAGLRDQVPALYVASQTPELAPNLAQDLLQLIELITRVN